MTHTSFTHTHDSDPPEGGKMDFVHGCEREGLENYFHECNVASTRMLLEALRKHHSPPPATKPAPVPQPEKRKVWFEIVEEIRTEAVDNPTPPRIDDIKRAVCKYFDLSMLELVAERRTIQIVRPRQIGMYLAKNLTEKSLPEIGRRFGDRDHTTVISAVKKIAGLCREDWLIAHDVAHLEAALS